MGKIDTPFDVSYTISFSGRSKSDGVKTITAQMIRDKMLDVLEDMLKQEYIKEYRITVTKDNIQEAKETIQRTQK